MKEIGLINRGDENGMPRNDFTWKISEECTASTSIPHNFAFINLQLSIRFIAFSYCVPAQRKKSSTEILAYLAFPQV